MNNAPLAMVPPLPLPIDPAGLGFLDDDDFLLPPPFPPGPAEPTWHQLKLGRVVSFVSNLENAYGVPFWNRDGVDEPDVNVVPPPDQVCRRVDLGKMMTHVLDALETFVEVYKAQEVTDADAAADPSLIATRDRQRSEMVVFRAALNHTADATSVRRRDFRMDLLLRAFPDPMKIIPADVPVPPPAVDGAPAPPPPPAPVPVRGWLPLHWAVLFAAQGEGGVTEEDVATLHEADPAAMHRHHQQGIGVTDQGYTPAHLLCMHGDTSLAPWPAVWSMAQKYAATDPKAFTVSAAYPRAHEDEDNLYAYSAVHIATDHYGNTKAPPRQLLELVMGLDPSQLRKKPDQLDGWVPLARLCYDFALRGGVGHDPWASAPGGAELEIIRYLIDADKSAEVLRNAIDACVAAFEEFEWPDDDKTVQFQARIKGMVRLLLDANEEVFAFRDNHHGEGLNLVHKLAFSAERVPCQLCIDLIDMVVHHSGNNNGSNGNSNSNSSSSSSSNAGAAGGGHRELLSEPDTHGWLPVHLAARDSSFELMRYLLEQYPEAASTTTLDDFTNLLHLAVDGDRWFPHMPAKVKYLIEHHPELLTQRDFEGYAPVHLALDDVRGVRGPFLLPVTTLMLRAGGRALAAMAIEHPSDETFDVNGLLPLHLFVSSAAGEGWIRDPDAALSPEADFLRLLLRTYPEAAGIEGGVGPGRMSPYECARLDGADPYFLRLLLNACPAAGPEDRRRFNYDARKGLLLAAFGLVGGASDVGAGAGRQVPLSALLARHRDILVHVGAFL